MWMSLCRITTRPTSPAKSRMRSSAGSVRLATSPAILEETNSLWMVNSPMPREDAGKGLQHAADVVGRVHVGRVEARDHGIEAGLLLPRQRLVRHRDEGVGERVVVEVGVAIEVVARRRVARDAIRPLLLQRDAEERDAPDALPHDVEEGPDVGAFLDVVGEVEMAVVDVVGQRPTGGSSRGDDHGNDRPATNQTRQPTLDAHTLPLSIRN